MIKLLANRLGSISAAISVSTGAVAADYDDQDYGARVETGAFEQPCGFTGREHDAESGLILFRARAYDPLAGVLLQADPLGFGGVQGNLYGYSAGNPINASYPSGLMAALESRKINDAQAQMMGVATTNASEGIIGLEGAIAQLLLDHAAGAYTSPFDDAIKALGPAEGSGSNHCDAKSNQTGSHAYMH